MPAMGSHAELSRSLGVGSWPRVHGDFSDHLRLHSLKKQIPPPNKTIIYGLNVSIQNSYIKFLISIVTAVRGRELQR